jgi:Zn-dependent protease with chaperone function
VILLALVPLLIGTAGALLARRLARRLRPSLATVLLTALALSVSLATGFVLFLAGLVAVAELPGTAPTGRWSIDTLRDSIPIPPAVGLAAGALAVVLAVSALERVARVVTQARRISAVAARLRPVAGDLVVTDDPLVVAYAIAGRPGRIVVSSGLLRLLTGAQRRALLAHEGAHLRFHHQAYVQLGRLAAAANPLMRPVARAIELAVERWADEAAVREVGDRVTVARALAAAALGGRPAPRGVLAGARHDVLDRVVILLGAPQRARTGVATVLAASVALCWLAAVLVGLRVDYLLHLAALSVR